MPSAPGYVRDYRQESKAETPKRKTDRAKRMAARRAYEKASGQPIPSGFDLDHKKPLSKGGSNKPDNWKLQRSGNNRSYPRTKTGSMKSRYD